MSGPVGPIPRNVVNEVSNALEESSGWEWFKKHMMPAAVADTFRPADDLLMSIAHLAGTEDGRRIFAWLHDLTDRAPYPVGTVTLEETAIAAARHQGRAGVGHVLTKAVTEGRRLIEQKAKGSPS